MSINRCIIILLFYGPWISTVLNPLFGFIVTSSYIYIHYKYKSDILFWFEKYKINKN